MFVKYTVYIVIGVLLQSGFRASLNAQASELFVSFSGGPLTMRQLLPGAWESVSV